MTKNEKDFARLTIYTYKRKCILTKNNKIYIWL